MKGLRKSLGCVIKRKCFLFIGKTTGYNSSLLVRHLPIIAIPIIKNVLGGGIIHLVCTQHFRKN